jgi:hypothetical protein
MEQGRLRHVHAASAAAWAPRGQQKRSKMLRALAIASGAAVLLVASVSAGIGQSTPSPQPGPTNPTSPANNPQAQPGATMVINPTVEQCRQGWNSAMKWTKAQFDHFCTTLQASK